MPQSPAPPRSSHRASSKGASADSSRVGVLGMLPYLLVLAVIAVGLIIAFHGSRFAGRGTALIGGALLAAALARLVLPQRAAGLLAARGKAIDVLAFTVLGGGVLGIALALPQ
jgi:Protein of unknown function (DUF3017)